MRQDGMRRRILVVERHRDVRLFTGNFLNLQEGTRREVPDIPLQGQCISVMARSEIRIERDSPEEESQGGFVLLRCVFVEVPKAALIGFPGIEPFRQLAQHASLLGVGQCGLEVVHFDRVEWLLMPDTSTAANALIKGEIDWLFSPQIELLPLLRKSPNIAFPLLNPTGVMATMRFNQLQPPFDNPAIRRVILHAVRQSDYMSAVMGEDRANWRDEVGYFCPDTPMANRAGMENLTSPLGLDAARNELAAAGYYQGERVVLFMPTDVPKFKALAEVSADLLNKLGFNVDARSMDMATVVQRRVNKEPVDRGGWSIFCTTFAGVD